MRPYLCNADSTYDSAQEPQTFSYERDCDASAQSLHYIYWLLESCRVRRPRRLSGRRHCAEYRPLCRAGRRRIKKLSRLGPE